MSIEMAPETARSATTIEKGQRAFLIEIYSGIQGEGILVGERMIFFRFTGCNLECDYCDTPMTRPLDTVARIERTPGARDFETVANPIDREAAHEFVARQAADRTLHQWISFTGGEPMLYSRWLERFLPGMAGLGLGVFLETNATFPRELERVLPWIDLVSMDVKEAADGADLEDHWRFLRIARAKRVYVKSVVRARPDFEHYDRVAEGIRAIDPTIPLVLQPVTPYGPVIESPPPEQVLELQRRAKRLLPDVRVIPQTHKLIGQL